MSSIGEKLFISTLFVGGVASVAFLGSNALENMADLNRSAVESIAPVSNEEIDSHNAEYLEQQNIASLTLIIGSAAAGFGIGISNRRR